VDVRALIFVVLLTALVWFWFDSMRARETAERLAHEWCRARGWQLLDGTVALVSLSPTRSSGTFCLRRRYEFAHTRGDLQRHVGLIVMAGRRLENFVLPDATLH
jgi:hypothetical protein